jgi:hypothetical protein
LEVYLLYSFSCWYRFSSTHAFNMKIPPKKHLLVFERSTLSCWNFYSFTFSEIDETFAQLSFNASFVTNHPFLFEQSNNWCVSVCSCCVVCYVCTYLVFVVYMRMHKIKILAIKNVQKVSFTNLHLSQRLITNTHTHPDTQKHTDTHTKNAQFKRAKKFLKAVEL